MDSFNKGFSQDKCKEKLKKREVGVYKIFCGSPVQRAFGPDQKGILYIGKSVRLLDRFNHFWSCAEGNSKRGHPAGVKFSNRKYEKHGVNLSKIKIQWALAGSDKEARKREKDELHKYSLKFGELPPLNSSN